METFVTTAALDHHSRDLKLEEIVPSVQLGLMGLLAIYGFVTFFNHLISSGIGSSRFDGASFHQERNDDLEMFNSDFVNVIEMSYWFVKFVENYESVYKTVVTATERIDKSEEHLFTK